MPRRYYIVSWHLPDGRTWWKTRILSDHEPTPEEYWPKLPYIPAKEEALTLEVRIVREMGHVIL